MYDDAYGRYHLRRSSHAAYNSPVVLYNYFQVVSVWVLIEATETHGHCRFVHL